MDHPIWGDTPHTHRCGFSISAIHMLVSINIRLELACDVTAFVYSCFSTYCVPGIILLRYSANCLCDNISNVSRDCLRFGRIAIYVSADARIRCITCSELLLFVNCSPSCIMHHSASYYCGVAHQDPAPRIAAGILPQARAAHKTRQHATPLVPKG